MSWLTTLPLIGKIWGTVDKAVEDKDLKNEIFRDLGSLKEHVYIKELETKTIPWVDALHKMGRQILALVNIITIGILLYLGKCDDPMTLVALTAPNGIYQYIKGKGR